MVVFNHQQSDFEYLFLIDVDVCVLQRVHVTVCVQEPTEVSRGARPLEQKLQGVMSYRVRVEPRAGRAHNRFSHPLLLILNKSSSVFNL